MAKIMSLTSLQKAKRKRSGSQSFSRACLSHQRTSHWTPSSKGPTISQKSTLGTNLLTSITGRHLNCNNSLYIGKFKISGRQKCPFGCSMSTCLFGFYHIFADKIGQLYPSHEEANIVISISHLTPILFFLSSWNPLLNILLSVKIISDVDHHTCLRKQWRAGDKREIAVMCVYMKGNESIVPRRISY